MTLVPIQVHQPLVGDDKLHAKHRNGRVQLYRSTYVRKGKKDNNTHGYAEQKFVGSLPADSLFIPLKLAGKLTDAERSYVESKVIEPARQAAEAKRLAEAARQRDPNWRIEEAERLLLAAGELAAATPGAVDPGRITTLEDVVALLRAMSGASTTSGLADHPLQDALDAIRDAARSVSEGRYGTAPAENVRATEPYRLWVEIKNAIDGPAGESLLRALQDAGFAKTKGK